MGSLILTDKSPAESHVRVAASLSHKGRAVAPRGGRQTEAGASRARKVCPRELSVYKAKILASLPEGP